MSFSRFSALLSMRSQEKSRESTPFATSGADLCCALWRIICNFTPILPYFKHWEDEPRPLFFSRESNMANV